MSAPERAYDPAREGEGLAAELQRLEAQAALSWQAEARRLRQAGLADGMSLLEVGGGPGFVTERLRALLPTSPLTLLDHNPTLLTHARARLAPLDPPITLIEAEAQASGLPPDHFDAALSRYLFQHLAEPLAVAQEVYRVLKPGGLHILIDVDDALWGLVAPAFPRLQAIHAKASAAQGAQGRDRHVGRRLARLLRAAGYVEVELDLFCYESDTLGLDPFLPQLDPARLLPQLAAKQLTMQEFLLAHALHQQFLSAPDPYLLLVGFIAYGRKPS